MRFNRETLAALDVSVEMVPGPSGGSVQLVPGGSAGAVPLRSAQTGHVASGFIVRPRFGWAGTGQVLSETGWAASPDLSTVQVWCDGRRFDDARPYDLVRQHDRRVKPPVQEMTLPRTGLSYLDLLLGRHEAEAKTALGRIAFHRPEPKEDDSDV